MPLYEVVGTSNPTTDWTTNIVLERDEETGEVTKEIGVGLAAELTKEEATGLEENLGVKLETVTKTELREREQAERDQPAGADAARQSPIVGGGKTNQQTND